MRFECSETTFGEKMKIVHLPSNKRAGELSRKNYTKAHPVLVLLRYRQLLIHDARVVFLLAFQV